MTKARLIFILFFSLTLPATLFAQDEQGKAWTLQECIDYALKNNIQVQRTQLTVDQAHANLNQSYAEVAPRINASANHVYNFGRYIDPVDNTYNSETNQTNNLGIDASVPLFAGFRIRNSIKQNKNFLQASLYEIEQIRYDVSLNVVSSYLQILLNKELLETRRLQHVSSENQAARTKALVDAGSLPLSNFLELQAQLATDELNVINAENDLELSKLQLQQLLLFSYDSSFQVVQPEIGEVQEYNLTENSTQIFNVALENQPIVKSRNFSIESAKYGVHVARGGGYPSLSAFGSVNTSYTSRLQERNFSQQLEDFLGQGFGLSLNIPIFNNWSVKNSVQTAVINQKRAELDLIQTKVSLRESIEQAYLNARSSLKSFSSAQRQVESLQEAFRSTEQRFNYGAINAVEYNVAKNNLNRAESDLIRAKYDYIFRTKILDFYQGKPLEF